MTAALDLQVIRSALKTRLDTALAGLVTVYANTPDEPVPPFIAIMPDPSGYVSYFESFGTAGMADVQFMLTIDAGARTIDAQIALDDFLGIGTTRSIVSAIETDRTLGGVVQSCIALRAEGPTFADGLVARIPIEIIVKKGG